MNGQVTMSCETARVKLMLKVMEESFGHKVVGDKVIYKGKAYDIRDFRGLSNGELVFGTGEAHGAHPGQHKSRREPRGSMPSVRYIKKNSRNLWQKMKKNKNRE